MYPSNQNEGNKMNDKKENKWTKYKIYKNGKHIDTMTKKQINECIAMKLNYRWISRADKKLEQY